jgi:DNA adenine methylase
MRRVFGGFKVQTVGINYTVGGAGKGQGRRELIVKSWPL